MKPYKKFLLPDSQIIKLIGEVKLRPCLWNAEDDKYNDRFYTTIAWKKIGKIMELPEAVVKTKWRNARDLFRREAKRYKCKTLDEYDGVWRHFHKMWFLHRPDDHVADDNNDAKEETIDYEALEEEEESASHFVKFEPTENDTNASTTMVHFEDPIDPDTDTRRRYNDDEFDLMYLQSLTPFFRQLEPIRKLVLRSKIQDMLMNEIAAQTALNMSLNKNN